MVDEIDTVVGENRRLQKDVEQLRARVVALESSRWWRLNPRLALARWRLPHSRRRSTSLAPPPASRGSQPAPAPLHPLTARFREEVVAYGSFQHDWFTGNIATWEPVLRELEGRRARILEIGSFEGVSACFLLWRLPDAHVTCVDTFAGSPENQAYGDDVTGLEATFDKNVALVDASRVRKLVGDSRRILLDLAAEGREFGFVYIDGSHLALDVMVDASLSWRLLTPGGVMVFDDYRWRVLGEDSLRRPGPAIDAFLDLVDGHCDIVSHGEQVIARKTD